MIPLSVPSLKGNEWKYVKECLDTEWVSSTGKYVDLFEQNIAEDTGSKYAVAYNNANPIQMDNDLYGEDRERLMKRLEENGIQTRPVWALNHEQKPYKEYQSYKIENAKKLVENSLCLPSSSNLTNETLNKIVNQLNG